MCSLYYMHTKMHLLEEQWKALINLIDQYNPICKFWAFFLPVVFIRHPDDLQVMKYKLNLIIFIVYILAI